MQLQYMYIFLCASCMCAHVCAHIIIIISCVCAGILVQVSVCMCASMHVYMFGCRDVSSYTILLAYAYIMYMYA